MHLTIFIVFRNLLRVKKSYLLVMWMKYEKWGEYWLRSHVYQTKQAKFMLSWTFIVLKPLWFISETSEIKFSCIPIKASPLASIISFLPNSLSFILPHINYLNLCGFNKMWYTHRVLVYWSFRCYLISAFMLKLQIMWRVSFTN